MNLWEKHQERQARLDAEDQLHKDVRATLRGGYVDDYEMEDEVVDELFALFRPTSEPLAPAAADLVRKRAVEAMVTAILANDAQSQAFAAEGLGPEVEAMLRVAASIIAGMFVTIARMGKVTPSEAWRIHMQGTNKAREGQ